MFRQDTFVLSFRGGSKRLLAKSSTRQRQVFTTLNSNRRLDNIIDLCHLCTFSSIQLGPKSCRRMRSTIHRHGHRVASLHEDSSRPHKLAHKAFAGSQIADNAARRNALKRVLAVPRDEMAVVDDVLFAFAELMNYPN